MHQGSVILFPEEIQTQSREVTCPHVGQTLKKQIWEVDKYLVRAF